jgi:hypothetical protein
MCKFVLVISLTKWEYDCSVVLEDIVVNNAFNITPYQIKYVK